MTFRLVWTPEAETTFTRLQSAAERSASGRPKRGKQKASKQEGLFKQVAKAIRLLAENPRHPGLATHAFHSLDHPYGRNEKIFEAYAQHRTPGAYRVFWCYGPEQEQITVIAITPHP